MDRGKSSGARRVAGFNCRGYRDKTRNTKARQHDVERRVRKPQPVILKLVRRPGDKPEPAWGSKRTAPKIKEGTPPVCKPLCKPLNSEEKSPIVEQLELKEKEPLIKKTPPVSPPREPAGFIYPTWTGMKYHLKEKAKKRDDVLEFKLDYNPEGVTETPPDSPSSSSCSEDVEECWKSMVSYNWLDDAEANGWEKPPSIYSESGSEFSDYGFDVNQGLSLNPNQLQIQEEHEPMNPNPNESFSTCTLPLRNPNINPFAGVSSRRVEVC